MKSTFYKPAVSMALVGLLQACASGHLDRQVKDEDHLTAKELAPLVVPEPLKLARVSNQFSLPKLKTKEGEDMVGKALDIRPPVVLVTAANGTYPLQDDTLVGASIGTTEFESNTQQELQILLNKIFQSYGLTLEKISETKFRTHVLSKKDFLKLGLIAENELLYFEQSFEFTIEKQRLDTVRFYVTEHSFQGAEDSPYIITHKERDDMTHMIMNFVLEALRVDRAQAAEKFKLAESFEQKIEVRFGAQSDSQAQLGWHITLPDYHVWSSLPQVLKTIGWLVSDLDRDARVYYIRLQDLKAFGELQNSPEVEALANKMMLLHLEATPDGFSFIYFTDSQGQPVSQAVNKQLEPLLIKILTEGGL